MPLTPAKSNQIVNSVIITLQRQREDQGQMTKQEKRAEQLMKRVTRDVHRLKRNHPNALTTSFR